VYFIHILILPYFNNPATNKNLLHKITETAKIYFPASEASNKFRKYKKYISISFAERSSEAYFAKYSKLTNTINYKSSHQRLPLNYR